jgi:hypothetical protein
MSISYWARVFLVNTILTSTPLFLHAQATTNDQSTSTSPKSSTSIPTNTTEPGDASESGAGAVKAKVFLSDYEFWLSAEILLFGFGVIVVEFMLLRHAKLTAEEALRVYAVTLIIVGTLFAITAGFDSTQIAPAMGLFGTIAGYLLGKRTSDTPTATQEGENKP